MKQISLLPTNDHIEDQAKMLKYSSEPLPESISEHSEFANSEEPVLEQPQFRRTEYDYLVKWLGRLSDDDAQHAFPILRQMRDSYHD